MKKYLLLFLLLFLWHPSSTRAIALSGAGCSNVLPGAGSTVSCTASNAAGRAQIVAAKWCDDATCTTSTSSDTFTLSDTQLNTYGQCQRLDAASGTDRRAMAVCIAQNLGANASNAVTLTVTSGNTVTLAGLIVSEVSGVTNSVTVDQTGKTDLAATATPITVATTGSTVRGNELVYTWVNLDAGTLTVGQPTKGGMGTNYADRSLGTNAIDEWNNASPRANIKTEGMSFTSPGLPETASQQQRGIIVTYLSPVEVAPTNLVFNNQAVGTTSSSQTITITNTGTGNLNFRSNATLSGANAADFAVSGASTCFNGANVAAVHNCSIVLTFTPSAVGTRSATVSINTNAAGAPHTATISGNGRSLTGQITINGNHP